MIAEIIILSVVSLLIIYLRNKKINFSNIDIDIKGYKLFIIMAVIQITAVFLFKFYKNNDVFKILSANWLIYPVLLYVTAINYKKSYMKLFFVGTLLNFIAIAFNDFKMPVYISEAYANSSDTIHFLNSNQDLIHSILTDSTRFKILCDIVTIPPPYPFAKTISIGDIFLLSGIFIFWQDALKSNH
ncbi:FlaA1/EpsC-like NDP-sugar epimerase [Sedimentibacter acidaminivorans]|uniref:FlaA1/EpsC-like NDP-sugar epimerase n=1 Tax=Sedimentibacter acidaminivorans TaxID=913099 RepID=A0ABS4GET5_9FIRM|nr:DUF5317 domain-containing protein [Sedimentibacter acidaminivorans]MBP1926210.1 FlaA1/EpsC-like NDP-sugar epimerase [Sedimentibacter acidaminivorans]